MTESGEQTLVRQVMTYRLKYGLAGTVLDAVAIRRGWDTGIEKFLGGLKATVEVERRTPKTA